MNKEEYNISLIKHWIDQGLKEGYPICCILFFCTPFLLLRDYGGRNTTDNYYIPCPLHKIKYIISNSDEDGE